MQGRVCTEAYEMKISYKLNDYIKNKIIVFIQQYTNTKH